MEKPTPRIVASNMQEYAGHVVRVVGKVLSLDGDSAVIETSDAGQIKIILNRSSNLEKSYVEILGKVNRDDTITEFTSKNLGDDIDMELVGKVVELTHKFPNLFPAPE